MKLPKLNGWYITALVFGLLSTIGKLVGDVSEEQSYLEEKRKEDDEES